MKTKLKYIYNIDSISTNECIVTIPMSNKLLSPKDADADTDVV